MNTAEGERPSQYAREVEWDWLAITKSLAEQGRGNTTWTISFEGLHPENVMKLERSGYKTNTFIPGYTTVTYTPLGVDK